MPQLVFPIVPDGLRVDVMVNLDAALLVALRSRGTGPNPVYGKGLVDTGSDITAVALPILQQLAVPVSQQATTQAIGGGIPVQLYKVSLHVLDLGNVGGPWFTQTSLLVMGLQAQLPIDVLIGMDVLLTCKTLIDGPSRRFALDF